MDRKFFSVTHLVCFFFFNDTATTEIYTLSLHDALPIYRARRWATAGTGFALALSLAACGGNAGGGGGTADGGESPGGDPITRIAGHDPGGQTHPLVPAPAAKGSDDTGVPLTAENRPRVTR